MRLSELLATAGGDIVAAPSLDDADPIIAGLTADSRKVEPGFLFAAMPGFKTDGRAFIPQAIKAGATAVLMPLTDGVDPTALTDPAHPHVRFLLDRNPRKRLALFAAAFHPGQPGTVVAVTGTNGKSSTVAFLRQIWESFGHKAASLGTVGLTAPGFDRKGGLTTPDSVSLHKELSALAAAGVDHLAMETSSHGLTQHRPDGVKFAAAALTNVTRDHMDYHADFGDYLAAKLRLFTELLPEGAPAVLNVRADGFDVAKAACEDHGLKVVTYGWDEADVQLTSAEPHPADGYQDVEMSVFGRRHAIRFPLVGNFQAENAACALTLGLVTGLDQDRAVEALTHLQGVPGRLEFIAETPAGGRIYVDYAHTPDAHLFLLPTLRSMTANKLTLVFGCGGDRDPGKRPMMGEIASRLTDRVYICDDNPRTEDPAEIRRQIKAACPMGREIGDRAEAIRAAAAELGPGDTMVVTGKGPDQGQNYGNRIEPFDDREEIRKAVAELGRAAS